MRIWTQYTDDKLPQNQYPVLSNKIIIQSLKEYVEKLEEEFKENNYKKNTAKEALEAEN